MKRKTTSTTASQVIATAVPTKTREALERIAAKENRTKAYLIRLAIDEFLRRRGVAA